MATPTCDGDWWSISTNWNISAGSLSSSISLDSPLFETLEDSQPNKPPLLLTPPSLDSQPCEINICFTQKQEVQQVYVRSTARVYEIYSASSRGSSNNYLCTVQCGVATRDDEVLHASDVEPVVASSKEQNREQEKENSSSSEDDWVDVKVLDTPLQDDRLNLVRKNGVNPRTNPQVLYEATAEFSDVDACTSLTLRLLSLQSKDRISIDEIYVYAEPADSADSEDQAGPVGNSATANLMSVLVPTLLQLSRSSNAQRQDIHAPGSSGKSEDIGSKVNHSTDFGNKLEPERNEAVTKPPDVHIPEQVSDTGKRVNTVPLADVFTNRVETVLEQLVSRVSRIEDICLKFEENMLTPIKSIEQRLQLVEEQVQMLAKNSQHPKVPSYTRISAPEFSCGESNSSSLYTEGNVNPSYGEVEVEKNDTTNSQHPKVPSYTRISAPEFSCGESNSSSLYTEGNENPSYGEVEVEKKDTTCGKVPIAESQPGLAISAPEFACNDDEENNDGDDEAKDGGIEPDSYCPQEKPRQALSIDDALAAALSGFMANTSAQPAHYTQALTVKAPEFSVEEIDGDDMATQQDENPLVRPIFISKSKRTECEDGSVSSSSIGDNGQDKLAGDSVNCFRSEAEIELSETVNIDVLDAVSGSTEVDIGNGIFENVIELAENGVSQNADSTDEGVLRVEPTIPIPGKNETVQEFSETTEYESVKSIFGNSIGSPWASCAVDFELPILDVKFTSSDVSGATSSLETLYGDMSEFVIDASSMEQKNEDVNIDSVPNISDNQLLFNWDGSYGTLSPQVEAWDDSLSRDKQGNFASLL